jgi:hypothetical protein
MGAESDFMHFLPRIFELSIAVPVELRLLTDFEVVSGKLEYGHWSHWPDNEQNAIKNLFGVLWRDVLDAFPDELEYPNTESYLRSFAIAEMSLAQYLDYWIAADGLHPSLSLARMLLESGISTRKNPENMSYWGGRERQYSQLQQWIHSPEVAAKLDQATVEWSGTVHKEEFLAARRMLL